MIERKHPITVFATVLLMAALPLLSACDPANLLPPDARLPDGSTYSGDIQDGLFHGEGVQEFPDGMVYRGQFQNGYWHGQGVLNSQSGWNYKGEFAMGQMSGLGVLETNDSRYEGEFRDDDFHGQGRYERGGSIYIAEFAAGQPVEGRHLTDFGTYQGEFRDWQYHGEGTYVYVDESEGVGRMAGTWEDGEFVGGEEPGSVEMPPSPAPLTEEILMADSKRLAEQIDSLAPERPETSDAYFLAVGGDGTESVFMRDIEVARSGLQEQFDLSQRTIRLLNHRDYETLPLASRPSIKASLQAMDDRMNPNEDLLVVHLVSHGGRDGTLVLQQPGIELPDLSPQDFGEMLETLKVRRKLIVVSACYSGHWIEELRDSNHWIMTSARKDRTSFGCGDDSEMTWFTKAVFQEVGLSPQDPDAMFGQIEEKIRAWEEGIGLDEKELSYPQMHVGECIRSWLTQDAAGNCRGN